MEALIPGKDQSMPRPHKYPPELRERATRMVFELRERTGERRGAIARVGDQLGIHREALRGWIRQAEIEGGERLFRCGARPSPDEVTRMIDALRDRFGVEPICRVVGVPTSTYYAAKRRLSSARRRRDAQLKLEI